MSSWIKSWNTSSNSITDFDSFQENYTKLGNVAGFEKVAKAMAAEGLV